LLPRLTVYPRFINADWVEPAPLAAALKLADGQLRSRPHDGWVNGISQSPPAAWSDGPPARLGGISTPFAQAIKRAEAEEILELEDTEALLTARGPELTRLVELADQRRWERAGDDVTYVVCRNINYTNVCYFKCGFCAFSKGRLAENLRGPAYLRPRRHGSLPAGRHPPGLHRRVVPRRPARREGRAAGDPHPRVLAARGLAGRRDDAVDAGRLPAPVEGGRARQHARHRRRDPR
jgi:hypothetical protein